MRFMSCDFTVTGVCFAILLLGLERTEFTSQAPWLMSLVTKGSFGMGTSLSPEEWKINEIKMK